MLLYSGDKPNPDLRAFVERHLEERPFDSRGDNYEVPEFTQPIRTTKNSPIYSMHPYHLGKKPYDAVQAYISHYTTEGDLVLDPFCGSGSTALAALTLSRKALAIDASPAATFITRFYTAPCNGENLETRFEQMCRAAAHEMKSLYGTVCHRCSGPATIHYLVYSNLYRCPHCGNTVSLYEASAHTPPSCPACLQQPGLPVAISPHLEIVGNRPVAVNFSCHGKCRPRRMTRSVLGPAEDRRAFEKIDLARIRELEGESIPYWFPGQFMMNVHGAVVPWGDEWRPSRNFRRISDLFTYRNLRALAALFHAAGTDEDLRAILTSGMWAVTRKAQHLRGGGGYIPGNWALPPMSKQRNVLESLRKVFKRILVAKRELAPLLGSQQACISTQSATEMEAIPSCSVDYIFTDPPYHGAVQYAELNFLWEAWLGLSTAWHDHEIIVNRSRQKTEMDWARMMSEAMRECHRVLKPGRWLSLCIHDPGYRLWRDLQELMARAGFVPGEADRAVTIETGSQTYNQRVTDKIIRRDLVINFRKPARQVRSPRSTPKEYPGSFVELAGKVIQDYLCDNPGATKDRIYDHFVSVMVRSGPIERHNFDRLLARVAREDGEDRPRWFRKE